MTSRQQLGRRGEEMARIHLEGLGYTIIETNYRIGRGEIDLIAEKDDVLVFTEVRTRRGSSLGGPEESITPTKQSRMVNAAESYMQKHRGGREQDWRIDVVAIEFDFSGLLVRVDVIENAIEL